MPEKETRVGEVTHYFQKIGVAIIALTKDVHVGETLRFRGHATEFTQPLESMQVDHANVETATTGNSVGMKVAQPVHEGYGVYVVE